MSGAVLVVGGYGVVGRTVCRRLAARTDRRVVAAGRTRRRAMAFADGVDGVAPGVVDVADESTYNAALDGVDCAVVCVTAPDTVFARACLDRGVDYVDISPSDAFLRAVEELDGTASDRGSTAALSVGLAPGMTNLLAAAGAAQLDRVDSVRLAVLLGTGEQVGADTYDWVLDRLRGSFPVRDAGRQRPVAAFSEPWCVSLPGHGRRRCYRYDLADQHVLARTMDIPSVGTWLCYDSRLATALSALAARTGTVDALLGAVDRRRLVETLASTADRLPVGGDPFVALAAVTGRREGEARTVRRWIRGHDQGRATAVVAAAVTERLLAADHPAGVAHSHQLFEAAPFERALAARGYGVGSETVAGGE
ncbi:saccharopine dehydrogenase family protein [Haloarcula onubensis]|uniref:Saccharopine dehydrogenase NADP-binding domain-containing protein n=1 Tax=Haloarcula onubensis TaxID=2950539 RepID=A0ABU2FPC7_9EURY|nr:saccharopine dehydrogenase NADP-binding domain-containing protein [Halomicroarcula sp. S3CR25-11]MDS0282613.1 saccharopine dehydrogenase NADP-binding domain-containing protein [Halomicroarcula sp. S3CR25-11]